MAFSSLADELAGAFDDGPLLNPEDKLGGNGHVHQTLADEFGLSYELGLGDDSNEINADDDEFIFGREINGIGNDIQHNPSTPPLGGHQELPNLQTPLNHPRDHGNNGGTRKVPYSPTNLDDTSPNRGIDLDMDLEMELEMDLRDGHSFSPHHLDDEFAREDDLLNNLDSSSRTIEKGVRNKSSSKSLRPKFSLSKFPTSIYNHNHHDRLLDKAQDDSLIILSECLASSSKLLTTLRELNGNDDNHNHERKVTTTVTKDQGNLKNVDGDRRLGSDEILESRLQNHLNKMIGVEKEKDHWIRDLNIMLLDSGFNMDNDLHNVDVRHNIVHPNHDLTDLKEEEETEEEQDGIWAGGWAGESYLTGNQSSSIARDNVKKDVIKSHEIDDRGLQHDAIREEDLLEEHVDPHDALILDDYSPNYKSSITPTTSLSTIASPFHQSHHDHHHIQSPRPQSRAQEPYLPGLLGTIIKETQIIILKLGDLNDKLHTYSSFNTSYSRQIRNIKSSLESFKEREKVELEARKRIEIWEESRLKIGLTRHRNYNHEDEDDKREERDEDCLTIQERLNKECKEFELTLNDYGRKLENLKMNTRILSAR